MTTTSTSIAQQQIDDDPSSESLSSFINMDILLKQGRNFSFFLFPSLSPPVLYTNHRSDPVVAVTQPAFYIKSARIYPLEVPGDTPSTAKKKYVCYEIALDTAQQQQQHSQQLGTIFRRYTDFLQLYENLRRDYSSLLQATVFPKKCFMGNFSEEVVSPRVTLFTDFLQTILSSGELRDSKHFLSFLQDQELNRACRLLDERRVEEALPILENVFVLLNKVYTNRSKDVLLVLCRLVAASAHPVPTPDANKWAELALRRFEGVCDADLLQLYVPLIKTCIYLFWKTGRDKTHLDAQIDGFRKRGINVKTGPTMSQAIHTLDPRTESA